MAKVYKNVNARVAHKKGVINAVDDHASGIERRAESELSQHRDTGHLQVTVQKLDTDRVISLVDSDTGKGEPAAAAIEYGYTDPHTGEFHDGLYILNGAAQLGGGS